MKKYTAIGLMSGTSMDGIDAALIETDGESQVESLGSICLPYAYPFQLLLKAAEFFVHRKNGTFEESFIHFLRDKLNLTETRSIQNICERYLNQYDLTEFSLDATQHHSTFLHALAVNELLQKIKRDASHIDIIGYHGQTVLHQPQHQASIQLGKPELLAKWCKINVVSEFRQNDLRHGGQGAPLAPLYHRAMAMRDKLIPCIVVNCGGIANLTVIAGTGIEQVIAYDAGPGNCLLDNFVRLRSQGKYMMDVDGQFAQVGSVNHTLIELLYERSCQRAGENFYQLKAPKSLDVNDLCLIEEFNDISLEDGCATLTHFTVSCIIQSLGHLKCEVPNAWILCGGGFSNPAILKELRLQLKDRSAQIFHADELGWNSKALEAELFAYLAVRSLNELPLSLPSTTGVKSIVSGGKISKFNP